MHTLDELARLAQNGNATLQQLVEKFLETQMYLPSGTDPVAEGVTPVLVTLEDMPFLVVATGEDGLAHTKDLAVHAISLLGRDVLAGVQPGNGVLINTEDSGFSLHPDMVQALLIDYGIQSFHGPDGAAAEEAAATAGEAATAP